ncbi:ABC transporter ATP-binding protein [Bordetella trematum]|nr:ABC transporter ATP-binding protein [Bordetella trematum]
MAGIHKKPRSQAFRDVLGFSLRHWARQPWRLAAVALLALLSAVADVLTPMYAGRLVDAVASGAPSDQTAVQAALTAFWLLVALGVAGTLLRQGAFLNSLPFTLNMMRGMANESFLRVQRLSSDWHANNFAGSTVRKVTRGMWAVDLLNDTLLTALLPSVVMLVGATVVLGVNWPLMGLVVGLGAALYIAVTLTLMLKLVAPAARLSNAWDTRMGGALADAVGCNAVVKAFGAEAREEARLKRVIDKWRARTLRAWRRITFNGSIQGLMMTGLQTAMMGASLYLWMTGRASVGDITFAMTMFFVLKGYLREVGMDLRNLQRSVNDMEELVALHALPLGVDDAPDARAIQVTQGISASRTSPSAMAPSASRSTGTSRCTSPGRTHRAGGALGLGQDHVHQVDPAPV